MRDHLYDMMIWHDTSIVCSMQPRDRDQDDSGHDMMDLDIDSNLVCVTAAVPKREWRLYPTSCATIKSMPMPSLTASELNPITVR